jgi:uncharacterized protein (TIGR02301 family)
MRGLVSVLLSLWLTGAAVAQQRPAAPPAPKEEPAPELPPAYEPDILRLAEVLGTLGYLSALCEQPGSESWQQRMTQLLEAEGVTQQRKERLAGAYNRGYLGHQPAHRICTERSRLVIDRLLEQGQKITRDLATRYSG